MSTATNSFVFPISSITSVTDGTSETILVASLGNEISFPLRSFVGKFCSVFSVEAVASFSCLPQPANPIPATSPMVMIVIRIFFIFFSSHSTFFEFFLPTLTDKSIILLSYGLSIPPFTLYQKTKKTLFL